MWCSIILVIAVGLQPERLMSWATALRYQALFTEAGGLTVRQRRDGVGNQGRVGVVGRTRQRRCAGRVHHRRQVRAGLRHDRATSAPAPCSVSGCWRWSPAGSGTLSPNQVIPATRTSSPYSLTDAVSDLTANTAATETDTAQPVVGHARPRHSTRSRRSWGRRSTACRGLSQALNNRNAKPGRAAASRRAM